MAINGAHMLLYTSEPDALRATLRDVFRKIATSLSVVMTQ